VCSIEQDHAAHDVGVSLDASSEIQGIANTHRCGTLLGVSVAGAHQTGRSSHTETPARLEAGDQVVLEIPGSLTMARIQASNDISSIEALAE
jgi:hypothetical protein